MCSQNINSEMSLNKLSPFSLNFDQENACKEILERICIVKNKNLKAVGFFISKDGRLATLLPKQQPSSNKRVNTKDNAFLNITDNLIVKYKKKRYETKLDAMTEISNNFQLLVLKIKESIATPYFLIPSDDFKLHYGTNVFFCGYPINEVNPYLHKGMISSTHEKKNNEPSFSIEGNFTSSYRGSPIVYGDKSGLKLIGIASSSEKYKKMGIHSLFDAINIGHLDSLIKSNPINLSIKKEDRSNKPLGQMDLVDLIEKFEKLLYLSDNTKTLKNHTFSKSLGDNATRDPLSDFAFKFELQKKELELFNSSNNYIKLIDVINFTNNSHLFKDKNDFQYYTNIYYCSFLTKSKPIEKLSNRLTPVQKLNRDPLSGPGPKSKLAVNELELSKPSQTENLKKLSQFLIDYASNNQAQKKAKKIQAALKLSSPNLEELNKKLERLNILEFVGKPLSEVKFPEELKILTGVNYIDLSCSNLEQIPDVIFNLEKLNVLKLRNNKFKTLPDKLCEMKNLNRVDILLNPIKEVPHKMSKFIHELPYMAKWV